MAYDPELAALMRKDLADIAPEEKRMFGGLAFMHRGHMLCGLFGAATGGHAMYRVGRAAEAQALALPGATRMAMGGRQMTGCVTIAAGAARDGAARARLLALALAYNHSQPAKG